MTNVLAFCGVARLTGRDVALIEQHFARRVLDGPVEVERALGDQGGIEAVHVASAA